MNSKEIWREQHSIDIIMNECIWTNDAEINKYICNEVSIWTSVTHL